MLKGKVFKNVFPYFNKIITATQKDKSIIEIKATTTQIIFMLFENAGSSIIYTIPYEGVTFKGLIFDYKELSTAFSKIKSNDDVEIFCDDYRLELTINDEKSYVISSTLNFDIDNESKVINLCETTEYSLLKSIEENRVFVSRGSMDYNNNLYFKLSNNCLNIFNTNDIAMVLNTITVTNGVKDCSFSISNEYVSTLYKWINAIKNLKIEILLSDSFLFFKTKNETLKLSRTTPHNIDSIIKGFENINNVELNMLYQNKLENVKKDIFNETNKLDKEDNRLILSKTFNKHNTDNITLAKKLFIDTIKSVSEDSTIGILDNKLNPVIITNIEEGLNHKIIFNTIN